MKWFKIALVAVVLVCFYFFIRATNMQQVAASLRQVGWRFGYALLVTFGAYWLATVAWRFCLGKEARNVSLTRLFFIRHVGETVGAINPTSIVGGEAVKVYLLGNKGVQRQTVVLSVFISRLLMIATQLLLLCGAVAGLLLLYGSLPFALPPAVGAYTVVLLFVLVLLWAASRSAFVKKIFKKHLPHHFITRHTGRLQSRLTEWRTAFVLFFRQHPKAVAWSSAFFIGHWLLGSAEFYIILHLLGVKATLLQTLLVDMGVIVFKSAGAFVPGQLGVEEYGNKIMLSVIGVADDEIWITASILRRTRQLFWIAVGMVAYFFLHRKQNAQPQQLNGNTVREPQIPPVHRRYGKAKL